MKKKKRKRFTVNDGSLPCINEARSVVAMITTVQVYILPTLKRLFTPKYQVTSVVTFCKKWDSGGKDNRDCYKIKKLKKKKGPDFHQQTSASLHGDQPERS